MQIVIDIPEDDYYDILQYAELKVNTEFENLMIVAIKNGIPLPKGHGRLIDADALIHWRRFESKSDKDIANAPTIIEADAEMTYEDLLYKYYEYQEGLEDARAQADRWRHQ